MHRLDGRRILITGASSGIGEAAVRACAEAGARVACLARRADRVRALAADIGGEAVPGDVADETSARSAVGEAAERLGGLDGLVNNAGIGRRDTIADGRVEDWRATFDVNVLGLLTVTQAALPHLRRAGRADVVNLGSTAGRRVPPGSGGVYSASKFAVHALTTALRRELRADGIRVTLVAPGFVRTPFGEDHDGADPAELADFHERKQRLGLDPAVVAEAIVRAVAAPPDVDHLEIALASGAQEY
jgi:NADP-dependent 3-hydroxy acid dehydrogenase YdfG